jgi:hypothetical protein
MSSSRLRSPISCEWMVYSSRLIIHAVCCGSTLSFLLYTFFLFLLERVLAGHPQRLCIISGLVTNCNVSEEVLLDHIGGICTTSCFGSPSQHL